MSLPKFSIQQPVFVNLFAILIVAAGLFSFISIPNEEWPDIPMNTIQVSTSYPGASPEEIEALITKPIEEEISDISDIDYVSSFTSEGRSAVNVHFKMEIADINRKLQEVQTEVNKVTGLPENAHDPGVEEAKVPFRLITIGVVGEGPERELTEIAEDLQYDFKKIYGVSDVELSGNRKREIWVEVDPLRLESYGLSLNNVMAALKSKNLNLPGGTIKHSQNEFILRTVGEVEKVREIENIVISKSGKGHVYIKDVAGVSDTFEEPGIISRINGKRAITISVYQGHVGNIADIVRQIKSVAMRYKSRLPEGAEIVFANDNSAHIKQKLGILFSNGLTGFLLVAVSLLLFIGARPAILTALGIPVAFCACILLMDLSHITISSISLFAMITVLGMIVDDAIVVTENVYRYIEQGLPVKEAALRGAGEVFWPVVAAVATTIAAFLPMLFMTGPPGKFMSVIPKVVIFALFMGSLFYPAFPSC
jgi:multidrug efflux pump subunit AcrB